MKIVYCVSELCHSGGIGRIITTKANYLARKGYEIIIITAEQADRPNFYILDSCIKCYDMGINYAENKTILGKAFAYPFKTMRHKKKLALLLNTIQPDIVISTMGNEAFFLYKLNNKSKKILEIHFARGYRLMEKRSFFWRLIDLYRTWQEDRIIDKYSRFVTLTNEDKEHWKGNKVITIPNISSFYTKEKAPLLNKQFISVGRLVFQKGYDRLIEAWTLVYKKYPDWKLNLYGNGNLENRLKQQILKLGLQNVILIHPPVSNIEDKYMESSGFILSSRYEGLPMVLLEAMSCGLPIISFTCPCGPKDIIEHNIDGILVDEGDISGLAVAIIKLIENDIYRKQLGKTAIKKSCTYSPDIIMNKWIQLFEQVLQEK